MEGAESDMFVNTNVAALNAWLNLSNTQNSMTSVLQQLSSGLKINSAADNPSGLAISQQMKSEISGMNQAYQNSQTAINLFQTADSALGSIQSILQSMRSVASQAATGTNNSTDLQALQSEMNQYSQQVTQISNDTNFNTLNLLGGGFNNTSIQIGADQGQSLSVSVQAADAFSLGVTGQSYNTMVQGGVVSSLGVNGNASQLVTAGGVSNGSYTMAATVAPWTMSNVTDTNSLLTSLKGAYTGTTAQSFTVTANAGATSLTVLNNTTGQTSSYADSGTAGTFNNVNFGGSQMTLKTATAGATSETASFTLNPTATTFTLTAGGSTAGTSTVDGAITHGQTVSVPAGTGSVNFAASSTLFSDTGGTTATGYTATVTAGVPTNPTAPIAPTSATFNVATSGSAASSYTNGTGNAVATTGLDVTVQTDAQAALTTIANAINTVSSQRATIGAYQNRLQFASSDLQSSSQNLTAAKAQITNADIALQMSNLTKYQILQQAGVGMLAQANAMPQALLKLIP